mgnify:CR=1 FL=1
MQKFSMHIKFTHHAQLSLYSRNFSTEEMKTVILKPDYTYIAQDGKIVSRKSFGDHGLEVVYMKNNKFYLIITAYLLD